MKPRNSQKLLSILWEKDSLIARNLCIILIYKKETNIDIEIEAASQKFHENLSFKNIRRVQHHWDTIQTEVHAVSYWRRKEER